MQDLMSKPKLSVHSSEDGSSANSADSDSAPIDNEKRKILSFLNEDICSMILDISFQRMLMKERLFAEHALSVRVLELWSNDIEGKGDFGHYRSRLGPYGAASTSSCLTGATAATPQASPSFPEEPAAPHVAAMSLLNSPMPAQVSLLTLSILFLSIIPSVQDPATSSARHVRLQICTSFIRIAKAADKSILPHMKGIADTMAYLQREGRLLRGEHNLLGEAFLVMASAAGAQQQQEVLASLLEPLSQQWIQIEWHNNYLSEPLGLVHLCSETTFMWSLFHTVTFFEKALKRSGMRKGCIQNSSTASSTPHPMASHLSWMLPPLFKLLRAIHALWSPSVFQVLPGVIKAAMSMNGSPFDVNKEGYTETNETDILNWLKGISDSRYNVMGLSTTIGDLFFKCTGLDAVALALIENIQSMEFRHTRQLVHSVLIPLVKSCPTDMWEVPDHHCIFTGSDLKVEVMEKLHRDLTREICSLLAIIASPGLNSSLPSLEHSGHVSRVDMSSLKDLEAFASTSMVGFLLKHKSLAIPVLQISLEAFTWTDSEAMTNVCSFSAAVSSKVWPSNAFPSADLILLSLPCITPNDLHAFEEALTKTASPKEQKQHMKRLLLLATGNNLKPLTAQKNVHIITNVTARPRSSVSTPGNRNEEGGVGLAAIL
ncbi:Protein HASTY 1 [Hibiscus syriacus]|uniref:Protein HASTY 1 n=1 Tax=Hibiscus syriacus TaxID=106335 RepID=A0A6A3CN37_HIBSY|nr:Protein HASTY 1 [Hibiscus syriacus]